MAHTTNGSRGWRRWPRYAGAILLAAAVQSGLGAWVISKDADAVPLRLQLAAYLAGCAAVAGIVGLVLCVVPLPGTQPGPQERQIT
jgi:hypothetical protein